MRNDLLKALALKAKNRLIHKSDGLMPDSRIKIIQNNDQDFYVKVKQLLDRDQDVSNPIKELMDETLMLGMTNSQLERYQLQTIEKYQKVRDLLESEKDLKVVY